MNKNLVKKILLPLFSLFLLYRTVDLLRTVINGGHGGSNPAEILILAFLLTLFLTGVFALTGFAFPTSRILHKKYYIIDHPKRLRLVYRILRVEYFRRLLMFLYWGRKANRRKYFDGTRRGIDNLVYQSEQSEFGHMGALISITLSSLILLMKGFFQLAFFTMIINIIGNLYPVILQRYHRMRVQQLISVKKSSVI